METWICKNYTLESVLESINMHLNAKKQVPANQNKTDYELNADLEVHIESSATITIDNFRSLVETGATIICQDNPCILKHVTANNEDSDKDEYILGALKTIFAKTRGELSINCKQLFNNNYSSALRDAISSIKDNKNLEKLRLEAFDKYEQNNKKADNSKPKQEETLHIMEQIIPNLPQQLTHLDLSGYNIVDDYSMILLRNKIMYLKYKFNENFAYPNLISSDDFFTKLFPAIEELHSDNHILKETVQELKPFQNIHSELISLKVNLKKLNEMINKANNVPSNVEVIEQIEKLLSTPNVAFIKKKEEILEKYKSFASNNKEHKISKIVNLLANSDNMENSEMLSELKAIQDEQFSNNEISNHIQALIDICENKASLPVIITTKLEELELFWHYHADELKDCLNSAKYQKIAHLVQKSIEELKNIDINQTILNFYPDKTTHLIAKNALHKIEKNDVQKFLLSIAKATRSYEIIEVIKKCADENPSSAISQFFGKDFLETIRQTYPTENSENGANATSQEYDSNKYRNNESLTKQLLKAKGVLHKICSFVEAKDIGNYLHTLSAEITVRINARNANNQDQSNDREANNQDQNNDRQTNRQEEIDQNKAIIAAALAEDGEEMIETAVRNAQPQKASDIYGEVDHNVKHRMFDSLEEEFDRLDLADNNMQAQHEDVHMEPSGENHFPADEDHPMNN